MQNSAWGLFFTTLIGYVYCFTDEKWYWMKGAFERLVQTIKELYIYAIMVWWSLLTEESPMNGCCYWVETPSSSSWRGSISFQVAFWWLLIIKLYWYLKFSLKGFQTSNNFQDGEDHERKDERVCQKQCIDNSYTLWSYWGYCPWNHAKEC